ncbi:MAG: hybrid sensor histidine kinase/response regulator [Oligoflexia bacterium]|nr:hybrid sensor histidine kinase/response regulator [Oligoflexia bacterium]MBF0365206.1 hybrid sensor histidine kinase/response regulator [Oligoflexia bacterium]
MKNDSKILPFSLLLNLKFKRIFFSVVLIGMLLLVLIDLLLSFNNEIKKLTTDLVSFERSQIKKLQNYDYTEVSEDLSSFYYVRPLKAIAMVDRYGITISEINNVKYNHLSNDNGSYLYYGKEAIALVYNKKIETKNGEYLGAVIVNIDIFKLLIPILIQLGILLLMLVTMFVSLKIILSKNIKAMISPLTNFTENISKMNNNTDVSISQFELKNTKIAELISLSNQFIEWQQRSLVYDKLKQENTKLNAIASTTQMLAHDVRKPFASIKSVLNMLDILKDNPLQLKQAKVDIEKSIKNVESMIADIMDFSREVKLETKPQSVVSLLDFSIRQTAQGYKNAAINFKYELSNQHCPLVDDERLARVFGNIIGNGIEAITVIGAKENGNIWIKSKDSGDWIEIVIGNDGPAFKEEDIPKLFDSFFTKGKKKGTGLGLASVQKIIYLHGGQIEARNASSGLGVEFIIKLPASAEKEFHNDDILPKNIQDITFKVTTKDESLVNDSIKKIASSGTVKMLLLEDEALYRASVRNTIKNAPELHKVLTLYEVHTVEDAIKVVEQEKIEWAIVDIDLGEIKNGFDFLSEARTRFPKLKSIVHSNRCIKEDKERARNLGAIDFVPKPLELVNLIDLLSHGSCTDNKKKDASSSSVSASATSDKLTISLSKSSKDSSTDGNMIYDALFLDDDKYLRMGWDLAAKNKKIKLLTIAKPADFFKHEHLLCKEQTEIYVDSNLGEEEIRGEDFAIELHSKGYKKICMASGHDKEKFAHIGSWLSCRGKDSPWEEEW